MSVLEGGYYSAYSDNKNVELGDTFYFLPSEKESKTPISRFKVQFKKDSLYVIYDIQKDTVTQTIKKGYKGKQKRNHWQYYSSYHIIPFFPIYSMIEIYRTRIVPNKNGDMLVYNYRNVGGTILFFSAGSAYEYVNIYKKEEKTDNVLPFYQDGLYGISYQGKNIIPPTYTYIRPFKKDFFFVKNDQKWGVINEKGDVVIPLEYDFLKYESVFDVILAKKEQRYGFLNLDGSIKLPLIYTNIKRNAYNGYFLELGEKVGYIKYVSLYSSNSIFIPSVYTKIEKKSVNSKYVLVYDDFIPLFVDRDGNEYDAKHIQKKKGDIFANDLDKEGAIKVDKTIYYPDLDSKRNILRKEMIIPILENDLK
ncbi:MAG: WG repeat-containing protein [Capnocytophaga sp.]|nr:WG repeat-containing protein [Capnocytophaga sp.]